MLCAAWESVISIAVFVKPEINREMPDFKQRLRDDLQRIDEIFACTLQVSVVTVPQRNERDYYSALEEVKLRKSAKGQPNAFLNHIFTTYIEYPVNNLRYVQCRGVHNSTRLPVHLFLLSNISSNGSSFIVQSGL